MSDTDSDANSTSTDTPAPPTAGRSAASIWNRYLSILPLLVIFYPFGLFLLIRKPRTGPIKKLLIAVAMLPLFSFFCLIMLRPFWAFDGGMERFWLDFSKGGRHSSVVASHRETQQSASRRAETTVSEFKDLWYPAFRGPQRDGIVPGDFIALDWEKHPPREIWRQPVGEGWSAFSIGYGRAYTLEQRFGHEAITCYDIATGVEQWAHEYNARFTEELGGDGPRSTPTLHDGRVYALGAEGHLTCVDAETGKRFWQHQINDDFDADNLQWAMSASPCIHKDNVIITNSGVGGGSLIAYRCTDGKLAWTADVGQQSYTSPMIANVAGREQLLNLAGANLNSLNPDTGELLWSYPFRTQLQITASQPIVIDDNRIFLSAGYGLGCAMVRIDQQPDGYKTETLWSNIRMKNKFSSSVYHDGYLYGLDERILTCVDATTGDRAWKGGRYNYGSLLRVQDHLLVLGEAGELALVKATPDAHEEVARIQVFSDKTWNNPSLVGGLLFARNHREMVCYDLRPRTGIATKPDDTRGRIGQ